MKILVINSSPFDSGAAFNRDFFMTEKVAGKIDFDAIEILPQVATANLDKINLAQERENAEQIIQTQRTAAWHILKGTDNENFGD